MRAIQDGLSGLENSTSNSNPVWTNAIATKLCEIGRGFNFQVRATAEEANRPEWLYDVIWLEGDDGRLVAAPFVAECEWKEPKQINYDFDKLLLARASVRLMIYDGNFKPGSREIAEELARRIREFTESRAEDAWLLAAWERCGEQAWRFRYFTVGKYSRMGLNGLDCFP